MFSNFIQRCFFLTMTSFIFLLFACEPESNSVIKDEQHSHSIPKLLDRNIKIQNGKEWDNVQNAYVQNRDKIIDDLNDNEARLLLAQLFIQEARITGEHGHYYPASLQMVDEVLNENPENKDVLFRALTTKAGIQLSLHEFNDALETGKKAINLNAYNAQIYGVLVDAFVELGQYEKAVVMAEKMIAIKPDIRSYSRVSYLREIHGDVEGAIEAMTMAVKAGAPGYEETAWAMLTLGDLYKSYGQIDKAEKVYQLILEERPNYPFAVAGIADVLYRKNELRLAEAKLNEAINIIPEVGYYAQLAEIYKMQARNKEFKVIVDEIFLMLEDDVKSGHNMNLEYADIYLNLLNNPQKALIYAKKEYLKRPDNIDVNRIIAKIHLADKNLEQVSLHLAAALITDSKHPDLEAIKSKI